MITRYKYNHDLPYSLHDMRVSSISHEGNSVVLQFENGYVSTKEPYPQVPGSITVEKVDADFMDVMLLSKYGKYGEFRGEKLTLDEFLNRYKEYSFEIVDELYGYNSVQYGGYLSVPDSEILTEMTLSIYYWGETVYKTEE